jgi:hypothetical protein
MEAATQLADEPQHAANDNAPGVERTRPKFWLDDSDEAPRFALTWKHRPSRSARTRRISGVALDSFSESERRGNASDQSYRRDRFPRRFL